MQDRNIDFLINTTTHVIHAKRENFLPNENIIVFFWNGSHPSTSRLSYASVEYLTSTGILVGNAVRNFRFRGTNVFAQGITTNASPLSFGGGRLSINNSDNLFFEGRFETPADLVFLLQN
jgi:hypothetical protein